MDYLSLYLTARILARNPKAIRLILASAIGALYAVLSLFWQAGAVLSILFALSIPLLMCRLVFGRPIALLLRSFLLFCLVGLLLGGGITALCHLFANLAGGGQVLYSGEVRSLESKLTPEVFTLFASLATLFCCLGGRLFLRTPKPRKASLHIRHKGAEIQSDAFCDSGNGLFEPISGRPCLVLPLPLAEPLLPERHLASIRKGALPDRPDGTSYRIVPCSTVGGRTLLVGFLPDFCSVGGEAVSVCVVIDTSPTACAHPLIPPQLL